MSVEHLRHRVGEVSRKIGGNERTTPEDVLVAAVAWAISDQHDEAATGTTSAADLRLLTVVRAQSGAGDGSAQAVCDAACQWRDHTRLGDPDKPGSFRWLLAQTVDLHRRPRQRRNRMRVSLGLGFTSGGLFAAEGIADLAGVGPRLAHQVAATTAAALFVAAMVIMFFATRSLRR